MFLDMHFVNKPEGFVQAHHPRSKFDGDGDLVDPETEEQLRKEDPPVAAGVRGQAHPRQVCCRVCTGELIVWTLESEWNKLDPQFYHVIVVQISV